jgi:hypothetical protein
VEKDVPQLEEIRYLAEFIRTSERGVTKYIGK